jgi:general secretion pathway protein B
MSYILDALKKSQAERNLGRVPTLDSLPGPPAGAPQRSSLWTAAALTAAVISLVLALYAVFEQKPSPPRSKPSPAFLHEKVDVVQPAPTPSPIAGSAGPGALPVGPAKQAAPDPVAQTEPDTAGMPQPDTAARIRENPTLAFPPLVDVTPRNEDEPSPGHPANSPRNAPLSPPDIAVTDAPDLPLPVPRPERLPREVHREPKPDTPPRATEPSEPTMSNQQHPELPVAAEELPTEINQQLPPMRISAHVYSDQPDQRFIIVNSRKLREGESTSDGLLLEEVRAEGSIFLYKGQRFFRAN